LIVWFEDERKEPESHKLQRHEGYHTAETSIPTKGRGGMTKGRGVGRKRRRRERRKRRSKGRKGVKR